MYRNFVPTEIKYSVPIPVPAGTEVIVANKTDLFRNISTLSLHGKIDVSCHLLTNRTY